MGLRFTSYGPKTPGFWTKAIYYRKNEGHTLGDPTVTEKCFFSNFLIFPHKLVMFDRQNTKYATPMHVFCAMFDRKGSDPFRVHKFDLFLISVQKISYIPKKLKILVMRLCFHDLDGLNTLKHCEKCSETWNLGPWFTNYGPKTRP